ncbi:hypothetical protein AVEN_49362-1 [Araneus ventricosus]|uniref:Mutator-like transposase domain-containing protein n=1 Tax=Araneus ventricosus TaxID=182803 RepID=A0A4Y2LRM3_ARAVE|nr:hypothetical protein AVEN_49362-1 [Araneus ventricosus]
MRNLWCFCWWHVAAERLYVTKWCVSVIFIDTGKILDLEVTTQYCKMCEMNIKCDHECSNCKGSSGNMEESRFTNYEQSPSLESSVSFNPVAKHCGQEIKV